MTPDELLATLDPLADDGDAVAILDAWPDIAACLERPNLGCRTCASDVGVLLSSPAGLCDGHADELLERLAAAETDAAAGWEMAERIMETAQMLGDGLVQVTDQTDLTADQITVALLALRADSEAFREAVTWRSQP